MKEDDKAADKQERNRKKILEDVERLSKKAQETAEGKQSKLFEGEDLDEDTGFDSSILNDTVNPQKSHELFYGIQRLLKNNLPSGKRNSRLRKYVYEEKNIFLNQGKRLDERGIRDSDGRMAPPETVLQDAFDTILKWVAVGGSPFDIYMTFKQKNEDLGYYEEKREPIDIDYTEVTFDEQLKGLLNIPPPKKEK